ncbi:MAG: HAD-IC family P-type ATPase [Firmicutes bacterium]|nr:HAD-IC family P-type ATPase [Bacillota bacterium]
MLATCSVVHALPGRLRLEAPGLRGNHELAQALQVSVLRRWPSCKATADTRSGRILVTWTDDDIHVRTDEGHTDDELIRLVNDVLAKRVTPVADSAPLPDLTHGLTQVEATERLRTYGANRLPDVSRTPWWKLALQQFRDPMTIAFCGVAGVSFLTRRLYDGLAMVAVIALNAAVSVGQETRLQREASGLSSLQTPVALVVRDGVEQTLPATQVVPGDVLILSAGDRVPADGVVTLSSHFEVDESCLTGESVPVSKRPPKGGAEAWAAPGEQKADANHSVYLGTLVTRGRARILVKSTGARTEMGRIADSLVAPEVSLTPLQLRLRTLGRWIVAGIVLTVGTVVAVGLLRGFPAGSMWMTGLTLAASAIPEGLPVLITIGLTAGVRRVAKRKAMIRRLSALETLGRTTVICSDKTGTLTMNEMTVRQVYVSGRSFAVTGEGYEIVGDIVPCDGGSHGQIDLETLARQVVLCSDATLHKDDGHIQEAKVSGDPTEAALLAFAHKAGIDPERERSRFRRVRETPFSSELRRMSVVCVEETDAAPPILITKGAVEEVLDRCTHMLVEGHVVALSPERRQATADEAARLAGQALRVLAVAYRVIEREQGEDSGDRHSEVPPSMEAQLVFTGLVAMMDPPRPQVKESLARCQEGGIRVVMITGDHPDTAMAIARQIGLVSSDARDAQVMLTGEQLDTMSSQELKQHSDSIVLYARVSPHHKLAIVRALQATGNVVAMTGDGVNDAPAIKRADVGIAMGKSGTEVAKEASALTIADDNFVTIIEAVKEGRGVLGNIRRAVGYLLSGNIGEVLFAAFAVILGLPLPLVPVQILLVNLLTDAAPTLALLTQEPPSPQTEDELLPLHDLTDGPYLRRILGRGVVIALAALGVYSVGLRLFVNPAIARTMAMVSLILSELFQMKIWYRDGERGEQRTVTHNRALHMTALISSCSLFLTMYVPPLARITHTTALSPAALLIAIAGALVLPLSGFVRWPANGTTLLRVR